MATLAEQCGKRFRIHKCMLLDIDLGKEGVDANELLKEFTKWGMDSPKVHAIVGDRRFLHFKMTLPMLSKKDLEEIVRREARTAGSIPREVAVLSACRHQQTVGKNRHSLAIVAVPADVWTTVRKNVSGLGFEVSSLTSLEDAMTGCVPPKSSRHISLLDLKAQRLRYIHAEHGSAMQTRRMMVPSSDMSNMEDQLSIAMQLTMEIPRTVEYMESEGLNKPKSLILSHNLQFDETTGEMIEGTLEDVSTYSPAWASPEYSITPGMATFGLMHRIGNQTQISLLRGCVMSWPRSALAIAYAAAGTTIAVASIFGAVVLDQDIREAKNSEATVTADLEEAVMKEEDLRESLSPVVPPGQEILHDLFSKRRPTSLTIHKIMEMAPEKLGIHEIVIDDKDKVILSGKVKGEDRGESLHLLATFVEQLSNLPYLDKQFEDIAPVAGKPNQVQYRLAWQWRLP